jgi:hypothetical protein
MIAKTGPITKLAILALGFSTLLQAQDSAHSAHLELVHDKPFVMVMVDGKGPFRFIIDTGTGAQAFVTPGFAEKFGFPPAGQARLSDPSAQGAKIVPVVLIRSLSVAGVQFTGVKALVHTLSSGEGSYDGLLGFPLFRDYLLTLDFPHRELTIASGALTPDGERTVLPLRLQAGIPVVSLHVGALPLDAQIDSGGGGLTLPEGYVEHLKFVSDPVEFENGNSLSTRFAIRAAKLDADVHLGAYTFKQPFVEIDNAFPLANFGSSPMHDFMFTFDQRNGLVRLNAEQKPLKLSATPAPIHLLNAPTQGARDFSLVPVD